MIEIDLFQVDAFASRVFEGNPAAVCRLDYWLPDDILQRIAEENNLSETAFFVDQGDSYSLRWFTPKEEVDLCGHATLAAAHVLFTHLDHKHSIIEFHTRSGSLIVSKSEDGYLMDFPSVTPSKVDTSTLLIDALGIVPKAVYVAYDYIVELEDEYQVQNITPNFNKLALLDLRGVSVTAAGAEFDFVSRSFFPKLHVNEDPVTGSTHCELASFWSQRLGKTKLTACQLSKRTGVVICELVGNRVILQGSASDYMKGKIIIDI
ncbi:PhzF family phenazine biosynthesis protein [Pseudoalteromonas sp.]|uniref:PhzF family phenazine biosynthesis protein n=1 Tax=Pseudoalteromonas sp. TaxID=53249 RepID=UPI0035661426